MKRMLCFLTFFIIGIFFLHTDAFADTLDVAALPPGNINNIINGDTTSGGLRANPDRVYRLNRGSVYQVTVPLRINGSLHMIATEGDGRPPVLAPAILGDGSSVDHFFQFIGEGADVDLNDLYIISFRSDGNQLGWSDGVRLDAESISFKMDGVIFDGFTHTSIQLNAHWNKINVQNCVFRNNMHSSAYFGGGAFLSGAPVHQDTLIFRNNTFFCNNSYIWSVRGYSPYALFDHNTVVYGAVNPFLMRQGQNMHITNNVFYASHAYGGIPLQVIQAWFLNYPDIESSSIIRWRPQDSTSSWFDLWGGATITGPEFYIDPDNGVTEDMLHISNRTIEVRDNAYFFPQELTDYINAYNDTVNTFDSIPGAPNYTPEGTTEYLKRVLYMPTWMSEYTIFTTDSFLIPASANVVIENNQNVDPQFDATINAHMSQLTSYIGKIATNQLDTAWFFNPNSSFYPPAWPLPENLRYSNGSLVDDLGRPLGDLRWYPEVEVKQTDDVIPSKFELSNAYPNPFNPETNIKFNIAKSGNVRILVYNILGQIVKTLVNQDLNAGTYSTIWNGRDDYGNQVASGIYLYSLETESFKATKKVMLMK